MGRVKDASDARNESSKYFIKAMERYKAASTYMPSNPIILQRIYMVSQTANWIKWTSDVYRLIYIYKHEVLKARRK